MRWDLPAVPLSVAVLFASDETHVATLHGQHGSGFALTDRRMLAWRGRAVSESLPVTDVDRILVDRGDAGADVLVLVVARESTRPPLVLRVGVAELDDVTGFVERLITESGHTPERGDWAQVFRVSFPLF